MSVLTGMKCGLAVGAIGVLSVAVGGIGIATAANGGSLTLGRSNAATKTTTLKDSKGTPLSLVGKSSKPPLTVNSSKQVAHLNASLLGGRSASVLASSGSAGAFNRNSSGVDVPDNFPYGLKLASTAPLASGKYLLSATADILGGSTFTGCFINKSSNPFTSIAEGDAPAANGDPTEMTSVSVSKPTRFSLYCSTDGGSGAVAYNAGIYAIRVANLRTGTVTP